jgi:hypothetical protein
MPLCGFVSVNLSLSLLKLSHETEYGIVFSVDKAFDIIHEKIKTNATLAKLYCLDIFILVCMF